MVVLDNFDQFNQCFSEGEDSSSSSHHHSGSSAPGSGRSFILLLICFNLQYEENCKMPDRVVDWQ